jgi:stage II sporulation protein D
VIERAAFLKGLLIKGLLIATGGLDVWEPDTPSPAPVSPGPAAGLPTIRVQLGDRSIVTLDVEDYLAGVVPLESPAGWPAAALQAQAIVARTYALGRRNITRPYDVVATDADQRYGGPAAAQPATTSAVASTRGRTLSYNGGTVSVFYSACCGGHTADAAELWGRAGLPYLRGVDDPNCVAAPDYRWRRALPLDRATGALGERVAGRVLGFTLGDPDDSGRPENVLVRTDGGTISLAVSEIRQRWGTDTVRSLWLTRIDTDATQAVPLIVIEGCGRGHGVGLCQWGARGMAAAGADAATILAHFFPGTVVTGD